MRADAPSNKNEEKTSGEPTFPVVGIGASAGGLESLRLLLSKLSPITGMAYVFILHLSPDHKSQLAEILSKYTAMPVVEAVNNLRMEANNVYVIPPNAGISISDGSLMLETISRNDGPPLPIDGFFRSIAQHRKNTAVGILLSGTGSDGTKGLIEIKAEGGYTFAQKPETAKFSEMPRSAIIHGAVDNVMTLEEIAAKLSEIGESIMEQTHRNEQDRDFDDASINRIMSTLKTRTGIDFSHYKKTTINRRIRRRMILRNTNSIEKYANFLRDEPSEVDALYDDVLINVTSFFRDSEAYDALKKEVWPKLTRDTPSGEAIRIWVPGCSSGEEVYSIAISLLEYLGEKARDFIIFGTDIDEKAIKKARLAVYPDEISEQVNPERLRRFFIKPPTKGYQIRKEIRDRCIFARHNVLTDAPFVNISLVSCRNLMIYLDNHLQDRIIPTFHYSLVKDGFLLLGKSESLGKYGELFNTVDRGGKVYSKRPADVRKIYSSLVFQPSEFKSDIPEAKLGRSDYAGLLTSMHNEVDRIVESSYAPAGVVVNEEMDVIEFRGNTDDYLRHSSGVASLNLIKMAKGNLSFDLRLAIDKARQSKRRIRVEDVIIPDDVARYKIDFEVVPFTVPQSTTIFYLIMFKPKSPKSTEKVNESFEQIGDIEVDQLKRELVATRSHMQDYIDEQEVVKSELRSMNEELRASYEELQSTNEELQSSREEIQASNEELRTVNDELADRNSEVNLLYADLNNFVNSTRIPLVMVDGNLRIRRITPMIERVVNILPSDIGRPIGDLKMNLDVPNLETLMREAINGLRPVRVDIRSSRGIWYSMRIEPYRTFDNRIDGAVIAFIDINDLLTERTEQNAHLADLERKAKESSEEVLKGRDRLQEAEKGEVIGKLTAMLAHDLKNPLNLISQASDILRTNPEKADRMLHLIKESAELSLNMIEELRVVTREINLSVSDTNISILIQKLVDETTVPKKIKVQLDVEHDLHLNVDNSLIRRVLDNLVSNAIEAMPEGGILSIKAKRVDDSVTIEVEDTGVGIPAEVIPRIFDSFYTTKTHGLGLGLAFSRRVVEAHGGTIAFKTISGMGTIFTITLPRR